MSDKMELHWYGSGRTTDVVKATILGLNSLMSDCVATSKGLVPRKTTLLQGSIQMRPAVLRGQEIIGYWGSFQKKYALFVEEGTQPHVIVPRKKKALSWPGASHPVAFVMHPGTKPRPYLRPSAERHYPSLPHRVAAYIQWGEEAR